MKKTDFIKECDFIRHWLRDKRNESGLSLRQLSSQLGLHHSILGKIETGERQVNLIEIFQYCEALNADPVELVEHLKLIFRKDKDKK